MTHFSLNLTIKVVLGVSKVLFRPDKRAETNEKSPNRPAGFFGPVWSVQARPDPARPAGRPGPYGTLVPTNIRLWDVYFL